MYTSTLLAFALAVTLAAAIPIPLELEFENQPQAGDAAHLQRFNQAKNDANAQIQNMQATLANPDLPQNAQRIRDAFGPRANLAEIRNTVNRLDTGSLRVATANPQLADTVKGRPALAKVQLQKNDDGSFNSMGSALIGSRFHKDTFSDKQRAGTLIHEATHQQSRTGDDVVTQGMGAGIVLPAGVRPAGAAAHGVNENGGYARTDTVQINSAADLSNEYTTLRDNSPNMHQNADSYRVFGALCSRSLYKRDPTQCTLPPDYFAKKLAAKAAAEKSPADASKSPTTKGEKLTTTKGANSKTATAKTTKSKGLMAQKVSKGSKALTGVKAAKGTKVAKGAKSLKGVKATKATKGLKAVKGAKSLKSTKATKSVKATKASKAVKGAKSLKGVKGVKATKAVKGVKAANGSKANKGVKSAKAPKVATSSKATLGKSSNAQKAGKSAASSKVSSQSSTKASPERKVKVTKPAAQVVVSSPKKKGGKKVRRDLDSVLEELD